MITFSEVLTVIEQGIHHIQYPNQPCRLYLPIKYILSSKGKKIRPALTLLACNLYQEDVSKAVDAALAWEIFHNFTLMHDDLMDNADKRRGETSVHKKWDNNTAILSGDTMLVLAYKYISRYSGEKLPILLNLFNQTTTEIFEGQEYDMQFETRSEVTEEEYLNMIRLKTAVMIGACLKTGAIIGGADEKDQSKLYEFGINLGLAFQIQDDILDVYGDSSVFGKNIGGDILCNKKTFLLISALNVANQSQKAELLNWLNTNNRPEEKINAVTALYNQLEIKNKARKRMDEYYEKAITALDQVKASQEAKKTLKSLAEELMNRKS